MKKLTATNTYQKLRKQTPGLKHHSQKTLDLNDESRYEDIDDLRTDKHEYLEYASDSISVVRSEKSITSSEVYIVPTPEYLDLEERSSDMPIETLNQNE